MKSHEEIEALSAYIDGELPAADAARVQAHLGACAHCTGRVERLRGAAAAVAALPDVAPDAAQREALRAALREAAPARAPSAVSGWLERLRPRVWGIAGAVALVAAGVAGFVYLKQPAGRQTARPVIAAGGPTQDFASEDEVRTQVSSDPAIAAGLERYRVGDVGSAQAPALEAFRSAAPDSRRESEAGAPKAAAPPPAPLSRAEPGGAAGQAADTAEAPAGTSAAACLEKILRTQPYPLMPLAARPATFKGEPVWLLVYAWTTSRSETAPLDRLQIWLVSRDDCVVRFNYSEFRSPRAAERR